LGKEKGDGGFGAKASAKPLCFSEKKKARRIFSKTMKYEIEEKIKHSSSSSYLKGAFYLIS